VIPNCVAYDPTYAYEVAVIVRDGLRRMCTEQEDVFYYLTVMNENYAHPPLPEGAEDGILRGMYLLHEAPAENGPKVQLLGSGAILREVEAGAELLASDFGVAADVWSVTSFTELRRDGMEVERWNRLHPTEPQRRPYVDECLAGREGPAVAASDYIRTFADQIRPFVPGRYAVLGTDGFGRSDYRVKLRQFFEVDRFHVAVAALKALADEGTIEPSVVQAAIERYGIDAGSTQAQSSSVSSARRANARTTGKSSEQCIALLSGRWVADATRPAVRRCRQDGRDTRPGGLP
jgi:pyruvate dehydrogenase E1 component